MARCGDSGACNCVINAGANALVTGSGTSIDPYVVALISTSSLVVSDTATIDMSVTGTGTPEDPHVVSADLSASLGDLDDVSGTGATTGQVLGWTGSQWAPAAPATAVPGAIYITGGVIDGDGSVGDPLTIDYDTNDFTTSGGGLALSTAAKKKQVQQKRNGGVITGAADATTDSAGFIQGGPVSATTDGSGKVTVTFPTAFASVVFVTAPPHGMLDVVDPVISHVQTISTTAFEVYFSKAGAAMASTSVTFSWMAMGKA